MDIPIETLDEMKEGLLRQRNDYIAQKTVQRGVVWWVVCDCGHTVPRQDSRVVVMDIDVQDYRDENGDILFVASQPTGVVCKPCAQKYVESPGARAAMKLVMGKTTVVGRVGKVETVKPCKEVSVCTDL